MSASQSRSSSLAWGPLLLGGLLVALGDMAFAATLWFGWDGAGMLRLFQTIAVGVLGPASFDGGLNAALLGGALHVFMATAIVLIYALVARRHRGLLDGVWRYGLPYGVVLYLAMNFVVMPLSRVGRSPSFDHPDWIAWSVLAHMLFGVICVVFARRALRR
ncbi:hypothetical protein [Lysobacter silvisoli]|uniref:DUF1440 domain-containing protein n=1 Tax=Lysobacter silvisoli TaxID=2293254 RepID=A0A371K2U2_9GAMM|nr:hypothetical protein [Lysobacter silvisoli]RDZ28192.1 hypothetical protein DX914_03340 [Lysobacter silvisoli]